MQSSIYTKNNKKDIILSIFNKAYKKLESKLIYVFLCGGNGNESFHIRNDIKIMLNTDYKHIKVLYPEDIFKEIESSYPEKDMLELETILANNSDSICIICESFGSATELGDLTNRSYNDELLHKIISVIGYDYKIENSFINKGPIKRIKSKNKGTRAKVYDFNSQEPYSDDEIKGLKNKLCGELVLEFNKIKKNHKTFSFHIKENTELNNFLGLAYFILLIIYFYKKIEKNILKNNLKELFNSLSITYEGKKRELNFYYQIATNYLESHKFITKEANSNSYLLTEIGDRYVTENLFKNIELSKKERKAIDNIRYTIMYNQLYNEKKGGCTS